MAGRRHKDFRSGDLNEELGLLLLKAIAAVAPVPRPEDVGIDAVATLLHLTDDDLLIAEDSFYVQFKSVSDRKVKYLDHEVKWLESLKLPFFIGSVTKTDSAIDLYATHRLSQVILERSYKEIELLLDSEREVHEDFKRSVYIGPPLLRWTTHDLANPTFIAQAYAVLKPYLVNEQMNIEYRGIRYIEEMHWETGKPLIYEAMPALHHSISSEDILKVFSKMKPHLMAVVMRSSMTQDRKGLDAVLQLADYMRQNGFDPDPYGMYEAVYDTFSRFASSPDE